MTLPALAEKLGCSVDELLTGKGEAAAATFVPEGERKDFNKLMLKIVCNGSDGDVVRINVPLPLVKVLMDSGVSVDSIGGKVGSINIDWQSIVAMVEQGVIGKLVEVDSGDGDHVEIVVE